MTTYPKWSAGPISMIMCAARRRVLRFAEKRGSAVMKKMLAACVCATGIWLTAVAAPHHSPAVFDRTKEVTLAGVVKEFRWSNPHSWIELNVGKDLWAVEMNGPSFLIKAGWKSTTVKPGESVTIIVNPLRTDEKSGKFVSITLADGRTLTERP